MARQDECAVFLFAPKFRPECGGRLTTHHVRDFGGSKDDTRLIRLCMAHHLHDAGPHAIERGKKQFEQHTGLSIEALVLYYREAYEKQQKNS
jgi:hypothetical protein